MDDHTVVRESMRTALDRCDDIRVVGEAATVEQGLELSRMVEADVAVVDYALNDGNGLSLCRSLRQMRPNLRVVGLSMYDQDYVAASMLDAGAFTYMNKAANIDQLCAAIREAGVDSRAAADAPVA